MPAFKSVAQRERLRELVREGKFPESEFKKMEHETKGARLPERANQKSLKIGVAKKVKVIK